MIKNKYDSFLNDRKAINRLKKEYEEHKNLIIGFDFDNTVFDCHNEGLSLNSVIELVKRCSDLGFTMCLHTLCLGDEGYMTHGEKEDYCIDTLGIKVDYVNESPVLNNQDYKYPNKPFYSILLDDRCGLSAAYDILHTTLDELDLLDELLFEVREYSEHPMCAGKPIQYIKAKSLDEAMEIWNGPINGFFKVKSLEKKEYNKRKNQILEQFNLLKYYGI